MTESARPASPPDDDSRTPLTREEIEQIARTMAVRREYRLKAIAARYGVSTKTLQRIAARYGRLSRQQ